MHKYLKYYVIVEYRVLTDDVLYETVGISDRIDIIVFVAVQRVRRQLVRLYIYNKIADKPANTKYNIL